MEQSRIKWERNLATKHPDVNPSTFDDFWDGLGAVQNIIDPHADDEEFMPVVLRTGPINN